MQITHFRCTVWKVLFQCTVHIFEVELIRKVMAHAQKPDLVFQRNGRVHLNRRGFQFCRLLAADACASAVVMLDRPPSDTVQDCWLPTSFSYFPFTSPPVRHRVPSDSERAIQCGKCCFCAEYKFLMYSMENLFSVHSTISDVPYRMCSVSVHSTISDVPYRMCSVSVHSTHF